MIRCRSPYDGVQRPLGEALARRVVHKRYHDDRAVFPGRGQLHQLESSGKKGKRSQPVGAGQVPMICVVFFAGWGIFLGGLPLV